MPKRTNAFQNLVAKIYGARSEEGATLVQSALIAEKGTSDPAEVDILISKKTYGIDIHLAIECRDHARPQGVGWIRELANKKISMNLAKVIAVSSSGFTKKAREKACADGVELLTLKEAERLDWGGELIRLGLCDTLWSTRIDRVNIVPEAGQVLPKLDERSLLVRGDGVVMGSVHSFVGSVLRNKATVIQSDFWDRLLSVYRTRADLSKPALHIMPIRFPGEVRLKGVIIEQIEIGILWIPSVREVPVDHYHLGAASVAHAVMDGPSGARAVSLVHWSDQPQHIAISLDTVDRRTGAGERLQRKKRVGKK